MPVSINFPIKTTLMNVNTPTANVWVKNFLGTPGNEGKIIMVHDNKSLYQSGGHVNSNGIEKNGTIFIGTEAVDNYAKKMDISLVWAARAIAIHELGHVAYQQSDYMQQPGDNAPMPLKVDWCLSREAKAAFFSFKIAVEAKAKGGNLYVPGTEAVPDLYNAMLAATAGIDMRSDQFEKKRHRICAGFI